MECKIFAVKDIKNNNKIVENMFLLMKKHYENMKKDKFLRDLYDKNDVFLLFENNELKGFSTIKKMELNIENKKEDEEKTVNKKIVGFFSGDTIIEKGFSWGIEFQKEWIKYCLLESEKNMKNGVKTYWFLISKGIKTYMYLPTYFKNFCPKADYTESEMEKKIKDIYAEKIYDSRYCKENGIVKNDGTNDFLRENVVVLSEKQLKNKNIQFFLEKNPNYKKGDELVCLAEISFDNLTNLGKRVLKEIF
ncbi:hypothetical protein [Leptotrichia sp. oral taxon 847]|uniref:hypothetical protein n=1 Tax=Leptotrichia sp. oral taxon 847 TaxID=1785996 RepID=UPI000B09BB2F|nr:hypothetical protein [Leptotrichia sp. oral taxon 847]